MWMLLKLLAVLTMAVARMPVAADPPEAASPDIDAAPATPQATAPTQFANARELLDALEKADRDIRTFAAQVRYTRIFELQSDIQTRLGELSFRTDPPSEATPHHVEPDAGRAIRKRSVAVRFTTLIAGGRQDNQERLWVFDGEWLVEKDPVERQFTKRRMVRPGQVFDPLRVGEGPFFVPVGQRRSDMENFFHASLRDSAVGLEDTDPERDAIFKALARKVDGLIQLELVPRDGVREVDDFEMIRVWYDPATLLPRASLSVDPLGDIDVFELFAIDINEQRATLDPAVFSVKIPDPGDGYHVEVVDETRP